MPYVYLFRFFFFVLYLILFQFYTFHINISRFSYRDSVITIFNKGSIPYLKYFVQTRSPGKRKYGINNEACDPRDVLSTFVECFRFPFARSRRSSIHWFCFRHNTEARYSAEMGVHIPVARIDMIPPPWRMRTRRQLRTASVPLDKTSVSGT